MGRFEIWLKPVKFTRDYLQCLTVFINLPASKGSCCDWGSRKAPLQNALYGRILIMVFKCCWNINTIIKLNVVLPHSKRRCSIQEPFFRP